MENELLEKHKNDPAWAEVIRLYSGLFDTQDERENFILDLAETDILLAAECKTSSVEEEENILDKIILDCVIRYKDYQDVTSLLTLIRLEEYFIIDDLLQKEDKKNLLNNTDLKYINLILTNAPTSDFIQLIKNSLPKEIAVNLLSLIRNNGYRLDLNYYKSLIEITTEENIRLNIYEEMVKKLILPDIDILNFLIEKSNPYSADFFYSEILRCQLTPNVDTYLKLSKKIKNTSKTELLFRFLKDKEGLKNSEISKIYESCINLSISSEQTKYLFEEYILKITNDKNAKGRKSVELMFYRQMIKHSDSFNDANHWFNVSKEYFKKKVRKKFINDFIKKSFIPLLYEYLLKIDDENTLWELVNDYYETIFPNFNGALKDKSKGILIKQYSRVFSILVDKTDNSVKNIVELLSKILYSHFLIDTFVVKKIITKYPIQDFSFLIEKLLNELNIDERFWTSLIEEVDSFKAIEIYKILKFNNFVFNQILYNSLIKKTLNMNQALQLLIEMENQGFKPDKFTYSSLLKKCNNSKELFQIIEKCSKQLIEVDDKFISTIRDFATKHSREYQEYFNENSKYIFYTLSPNWFKLISKISDEFAIINTVDCKITKIIPSRVFVKIEGETRNVSIYIGELTNQRLANIYDFEYNGEKLHIGQKLTAKIISIDEKNGIQLSLKQVK